MWGGGGLFGIGTGNSRKGHCGWGEKKQPVLLKNGFLSERLVLKVGVGFGKLIAQIDEGDELVWAGRKCKWRWAGNGLEQKGGENLPTGKRRKWPKFAS